MAIELTKDKPINKARPVHLAKVAIQEVDQKGTTRIPVVMNTLNAVLAESLFKEVGLVIPK